MTAIRILIFEPITKEPIVTNHAFFTAITAISSYGIFKPQKIG